MTAKVSTEKKRRIPPKGKRYEVWIENGLRMQEWGELGGEAGPMPKSAADKYVKDFANNGIHAEARKMG